MENENQIIDEKDVWRECANDNIDISEVVQFLKHCFNVYIIKTILPSILLSIGGLSLILFMENTIIRHIIVLVNYINIIFNIYLAYKLLNLKIEYINNFISNVNKLKEENENES